jgi:hypothetical protein
MSQAHDIGFVKGDSIPHGFERTSARELPHLKPEDQVMGILAGQALTTERSVKEAVASQRSQSVEMRLGRGLQGRELFQHAVRPIP